MNKQENWHKSIIEEFPIFKEGLFKEWIYLDNAATMQKPIRVIKAIESYYSSINANVHRGVHAMSQRATMAMEESRKKIQHFLNARYPYEIIFTKGTTDSINLLAHAMGDRIKKGDEILITGAEHHSNIIPWQVLCKAKGAFLKVIPIDKQGLWKWEDFDRLLCERTKLLSIYHISNALGSINPIEKMIEKAHKVGALVLIDGAQAPSHIKVDVRNLDVDFYAFSAHKMYGPSGIGCLYGKESLLEKLNPYQLGGGMIKEVYFDKTTYAELPFKFEAGTPNLSAVAAWDKAIDFINEIGIEKLSLYEDTLLDYAQKKLSQIEGVRIYGEKKSSIISFTIEGMHPFDIGGILDRMNIAVRTGHHCAQPLMRFLGIEGTIRISLAVYNSLEQIDRLYEALLKAKKMLY